MKKIKVKLFNKSNNPNPSYATLKSAGMDVLAYLDELVTIKGANTFLQDNKIIIHPNGWALIPTGLYVNIPDDYEIQVRPKSGKALKCGITVLNTPGTVDADYLYEVGVIVHNISCNKYEIKSGDAIAQLVLNEVPQIEWENISEEDILKARELQESQENSRKGGFGSTSK